MTLLELRKVAGLTQSAFAASVGVSQTAVCKWERGTALPSVDKLPDIACVLGCSLDVLVFSLLEEGGDLYGSRLHQTDNGHQGGERPIAD